MKASDDSNGQPQAPDNQTPAEEPSGFLTHNPFRALRHSSFRSFWLGQFVSLTGSWMQGVAQRWLVYQLTRSESILGLVNALMTVPVAVLAPFSGALADRYEKRRILMTIQATAASMAMILWFLTWTGRIQISHIFLLSIGLGLVRAFDVPTRQSFWADLVGKDDLMSAISLNSAAVNLSRILGPSFAGVLIASVSLEICFLLNAVSFAPSFFALLLMPPMPVPRAPRKNLFHSVVDGLNYVRTHPSVFHLLLLIATWSLFAGQFDVLLPVMADQIFKVGPKGYGFLTAAIGIGAVAGALLAASLGGSKKRGRLLLIGTLLASFSLLLFSRTSLFAVALLTLFSLGIGMVLQNATANTLVQTLVPDQMRGRVMGLYSIMLIGLAPIGSLFYGFVGQTLGAPASFFCGGVFLLMTNSLIHWRDPGLRHLP
ncbi:MAG: MFS transporter [Armatimonadetes bacterium]|nr:MFS transporter [Armatimonadota bacterium]MDW8122029.1 MFS transporter [Armatimonadota bacterium]